VQLKVSDSRLVPGLVEFLTANDGFVTRLEPDLVEVGFLGSLNAAAQIIETERRVRTWMASHPEVIVVVSEAPNGVADSAWGVIARGAASRGATPSTQTAAPRPFAGATAKLALPGRRSARALRACD
jgi:hypothetical protein